jgi:hypothetical protein
MRFQRDAMALTLAADKAPFEPVAREVLRTETRHQRSRGRVDSWISSGRKQSILNCCRLPNSAKLSNAWSDQLV